MRANALATIGGRLLLSVGCVVSATGLTWLIDALHVFVRGGGVRSVPLMFSVVVLAAVVAGVGLWVACELLLGLGELLAASLRRVDVICRVRSAGSSRAWLPATATLLALATHYVNAQFYSGLYPQIHRPMTVVTVFLLLVAVAPLMVATSVEGLALGVSGVCALALLSVPFAGIYTRARAPVVFFGTEQAHFLALVDALLDRDRDGYSAHFGGGDCDDSDPEVNPAAPERAGNHKDDDCVRGDLPRGAAMAATPPMIATAPDLAAWRAAHPKPNVLLIFIDTLRADRVGAFGSTAHLTPNLDALAHRSVVFEQARTIAPRTPHATMGLLRGRFDGRVLERRSRIAEPGRDTLQAHLRDVSYRTFARLIDGSWPFYHLDTGWDVLDMKPSINAVTGELVTSDAERLLATAAFPFLMLLHYTDPHTPYLPHPQHRFGGSMSALYDGEVAYTDAQIGALLDYLQRSGRMRDTVIVVYADHGENLGDHGDAGGHHGISVFDEVVHVPLMILAPDVVPRRIEAPVSLADVAPTLLDLIGAQPLNGADGCSLAGYLLGRAPAPAYTISEFYDFGHLLRSIVKGRYKLIYDLPGTPGCSSTCVPTRRSAGTSRAPGPTSYRICARPWTPGTKSGWTTTSQPGVGAATDALPLPLPRFAPLNDRARFANAKCEASSGRRGPAAARPWGGAPSPLGNQSKQIEQIPGDGGASPGLTLVGPGEV